LDFLRIRQRLTVIFDEMGLAGIRVRWKFDDMFAGMIAEDFDINRNGRLDPEEVIAVQTDGPFMTSSQPYC
jgi:ABC-type uncharacterized transport system substrate-binding protein